MDVEGIVKLVTPAVKYTLKDLGKCDKTTAYALYKNALITYLITMGYPPRMAIRTVNTWFKCIK